MSVQRTADIIDTIAVGNTLGEGVLWNEKTQTVWWVDIQQSKLHCLKWPSKELTVFDTPERLCSFGFVEGTEEWLVAAFETGFALYNPATSDVEWLAKPAELKPGRRLNDGRVGPDGRFWAGSMIENDDKGLALEETGFYSLSSDGVAELRHGGLRISNGLCWSPDGDVVYFADSPAQQIFAASYNRTAGFDGVREFAMLEAGGPDGATTDAQGRLWSAVWGGRKLLGFNPAETIEFDLRLPVPQPTIPAFGGLGLDLIFVASAREDLTEKELAASPSSGDLLVIKAPTGVSGMAANRFKLKI